MFVVQRRAGQRAGWLPAPVLPCAGHAARACGDVIYARAGSVEGAVDLSQLRLGFFDEAGDTLDSMEQVLLSGPGRQPAGEWVNAAFRAAHSLKGGAAAFGFADVSQLMHLAESVLERLRGGQADPGAQMLGLLLETVDAVRRLLAHHQAGVAGGGDGDATGALAGRLRAVGLASQPPAVRRRLEIRIGAGARLADAEAVVAMFRDLPDLGEVNLLSADRHADGRAFAIHTDLSEDELLDLCVFHVAREQVSVRAVPELQKSPPAAVATGTAAAVPPVTVDPALLAPAVPHSMRVASSRVNQLAQLAADIAISEALLRRNGRGLDTRQHADLLAGIDALRRHAHDLQRLAAEIRSTPITVLFQRFPRMLRELSVKLGKTLTLVTSGGDTQLDRALAEKIGDPLAHLVRNSCDHGIEAPAERVAAGKPAVGTIALSADRQGDAIVVEVRDDGRGMAREKIVAAALLRGLHVPDQMTDREVWQLVLLPGLSTAGAVTDISGRGVGMDVVGRNLGELGGSVEIDSVPGAGTTVRLRLPLLPTCAEGLLLAVGGDPYFLPKGAYANAAATDVLDAAPAPPAALVDTERLPVVELHRLVGGVPAVGASPVAVVVVAGGRKLVMTAERWSGPQHVVATSSDTHSAGHQLVSGTALLTDGLLAPILDAAALVQLGHAYSA